MGLQNHQMQPPSFFKPKKTVRNGETFKIILWWMHWFIYMGGWHHNPQTLFFLIQWIKGAGVCHNFSKAAEQILIICSVVGKILRVWCFNGSYGKFNSYFANDNKNRHENPYTSRTLSYNGELSLKEMQINMWNFIIPVH